MWKELGLEVKTWKVLRACPQILPPRAAGGGQAHHGGDGVRGAQSSSPMALKSEIGAGRLASLLSFWLQSLPRRELQGRVRVPAKGAESAPGLAYGRSYRLMVP